MRKVLPGAVLICALLTWSADATHPANNRFIDVVLNGQNVPGGAGEPDAVGTARLEEDHGTLAWQITYNNVGGETITGLHVHGQFGNFEQVPFINIPLPADRPLPGGTMSGVMRPVDDPGLLTKMAFVFFGGTEEMFLDLHTSGAGGFPDGAIRGQLPEPGIGGLVALGIWASLRRRRR
jgi:hypothetical protein